ncbi:hypothetical protein ALQ64_03593 [Pseudomonas cannabina]|uniref:Uncharacterized protein n=1 Tax=Pseudomonas cannabina TaxID=86840 RepID=A0A3M3K668_PSECA|nr:hypothetical protein ALQ64_03593 [Pseudomonas cannabina]SDQ62733.1 hypothetical protein SAMN05216597_0736 [Pseudomonas cannabina]
MKNRFKLFVGVTAMALSLSAFAKPALHTATIDQHGNIVAQSSPWIKSVSYATQKDYFAKPTKCSSMKASSKKHLVFVRYRPLIPATMNACSTATPSWAGLPQQSRSMCSGLWLESAAPRAIHR